jgi:hypothetical protein
MPDITLSLTITRTLLSLATLELNDHTISYVAAESTPGPVTWDREQVRSQWVDGDITVSRRRANVIENLTLEVLGANAAGLQTNLGTILNAFKQATYTLTSTFNGTSYAWACEAADYQVLWTGPRMVSNQVQLQLQIPRSPIPTIGPF